MICDTRSLPKGSIGSKAAIARVRRKVVCGSAPSPSDEKTLALSKDFGASYPVSPGFNLAKVGVLRGPNTHSE